MLFLLNPTKTWDGPLYPFLGSIPNTNGILDTTTYHRIDDFNPNTTISKSRVFLGKRRKRFTESFKLSINTELFISTSCDTYQQPYMKLLPKVHKLHHPASTDKLAQLTGRPIITAHSWVTYKPSRLLGEELDKLLFQIRDIFKNRQIKFLLLNNSFDLLVELQNIRINDIDKYTLTTFDFTSLYTNISYPDAIHAIIDACKLLNKPTSYRDLLLNLNHFVNNNNFFVSGCTTFQHCQVKGVAMGSYHSRQIADLVLLLSDI